MIRLALLEELAQEAQGLLAGNGGLERGAFYLMRQGRGAQDTRLIASGRVQLPPDPWEEQGIGILRPTAQCISAAVSQAIEARSGLLFVHTHPDPEYPLGLSLTDLRATRALAPTIEDILRAPFAAVVIHPRGWAGVLWKDGDLESIGHIQSIGRRLTFLSPAVPLPKDETLDSRQTDALGKIQTRLRQLDVGIVGCGGTGSPTAEQLIRMGVHSVSIVDQDRLDTPSNLRRMFATKLRDLKPDNPEFKVAVVARNLDEIGLGVAVDPIHEDVRKECSFRRLLDMDVVFCCTDTHGSRAAINDLASAYFLPVIDVGVRVGTKGDGLLAGLLSEIRVITPTTPCLWCTGTIDGDAIRRENLPPPERKKLEEEGYIPGGSQDPAPAVAALTVLASGMATCAMLGLLAEEGDVIPSVYWFDGLLGDSAAKALNTPKAGCWCRKQLGLGDLATLPLA